MGQESSGGNQWKDAVSRYEKADSAEFSVHHRLLHGGESRMAVPTLQWRYHRGQADGSFYELRSGLQELSAKCPSVRLAGGSDRCSSTESRDLL